MLMTVLAFQWLFQVAFLKQSTSCRMKCSVYLFVCIYLGQLTESVLPNEETVENYIDGKILSLQAKQKTRMERSANELNVTYLNDDINKGLWKFTYPFTLFNDSYLLSQNDILVFRDGNLIPVTSMAVLHRNENISSAEVIEVNDGALMLLVLDTKFIKIVKFDLSLKIQEIQTIQHVQITDTLFFEQKGKIYLVVSNARENDIMPNSLYRWENDHFHEIETLYMKGVYKIETFADEEKQIILMLQEKLNSSFCNIYEFEGNILTKKHVIEVDRPQSIVPYTFKNEKFILFVNQVNSFIYQWSGLELLKWSTVKSNLSFDEMFLSHSENTSVVYGIALDKFVVFKPNSEELEVLQTEIYRVKFTTILKAWHITRHSSDYLVIVGNIQNRRAILTYSVPHWQPINTDTPSLSNNLVTNCLTTLHSKLEIEEVDTGRKKILHDMSKQGTSKPMPVYSIQSRTHDVKDIELEDKFGEIQEKVSSLAPLVDSFEEGEEETQIVNGDLFVSGTLVADELTSKDVKLKTVNDKKWTPNQWLSYTRNQTIPGSVDASSLSVKHLVTTPETKIFNDLLLNNTNTRIPGRYVIKNLNTTTMDVKAINNIKMDDVFWKNRDSVVTGIKNISHLTANSIKAVRIKGRKSQDVLEQLFASIRKESLKFASHVRIDDLEVNDIDGVNWNTFKHSVFRYGISKEVTGNLKIRTFDAENLEVLSVNRLKAENFMTTSTDQRIDSSLEFNHIYASNITARTVNGVNLRESVASVIDPRIRGPVTIEEVHILGNLILNYSLDESSFITKNQHIVGTLESDLLQIYTDKIKIIGNLHLKNLRTTQFSSIVVEGDAGEDDKEFNPDIEGRYWMKNKNQVIPVHLEAQEGLTTPHLQTKLLNGIGVLSYLFNNTRKSLPASYNFENATFLKNVILNDRKSHVPNLQKIEADSVRLNGSFVVHGKKIFRDTLKIKNLLTDNLNDVLPSELVTANTKFLFSGKKIFELLIVNGDLKTKNHSTPELNGVNLGKFQNDAVYINTPQKLNSLNFSVIEAENLNAETLNDRPIGEYITLVNDMFDSGAIDSLIINGKLAIGNVLNLSKINEKDPDVMFANKLKLDEQGVLHGNIRFVENVTIDNLSATHINNINFPVLANRLFYKSGNQTVPAKFTFHNLKTDNLLAPKINDVTIQPLVNVRSFDLQRIFAPNGMQFNQDTTVNIANIENMSPCNVDLAMEAMRAPPTQHWSNMIINGNVTILDEENVLYSLFENVVLANAENIITAPVQFSNVTLDNLLTFESINGINLTEILNDALLKESQEVQVITGKNIFERIAAYSVNVQNNSDIPVVNEIEISQINNKIIPKDEIHRTWIRGTKTFFAGLQTEKIQSEKVANVLPENLISIHDERIIPSATFESVEVKNNLVVDRINDQNMDSFLTERLLIRGPIIQEISAICSFNDVHIAGNVTTPSINDLELQDVVFDIGNQTITSHKTFMNDLYVVGNINIDMLNGHMISQIYQTVLLRNEETHIKQNVEIMKPSSVNGTITSESINGYPIEKMKRILDPNTRHHYVEQVHEVIENIEKSAKINFKLIEKIPSEIMYLEKTKMIDFSYPTIIYSQAIQLKDYVMVHVIGEEDGIICGLPRGCKCPVQRTMQISPEHSFNTITTKDSQRVYSYDDEKMTVHFITDNVDRDMVCRSNNSESKRSSLAWNTWNTHKGKNSTGEMYTKKMEFAGYVSSVEYFVSNGNTYVIVGKYFDASVNSYELDCTLLKFDDSRTDVQEIQKIKTNGVWSLKIFYTVQGINLIVGMLGDGHPNHNVEKSLILRFDPIREQFLLLREVQGYGCSSSVGIALGDENFIALAHRKYPVLVFKYDHSQDNYVYYQNLWDPLPTRGLSVFYSKGLGISDPYLCVVSARGTYSVYTYKFIEGWQTRFHGELKGLRKLIPFELNEELFLFAPATNVSSVLSIIKFG